MLQHRSLAPWCDQWRRTRASKGKTEGSSPQQCVLSSHMLDNRQQGCNRHEKDGVCLEFVHPEKGRTDVWLESRTRKTLNAKLRAL